MNGLPEVVLKDYIPLASNARLFPQSPIVVALEVARSGLEGKEAGSVEVASLSAITGRNRFPAGGKLTTDRSSPRDASRILAQSGVGVPKSLARLAGEIPLLVQARAPCLLPIHA